MRIQVSLNEDDFNQVYKIATEKHVSLSTMAKMLIVDGFKKKGE